MQEPRIETKPPMRLIGLQAKFISGLSPDTNAPDVIGPLWGGLNARMAEIQRSDEKTCYGFCCAGDPAERTRPDELLYLAGAPVAADAPVPEGLVAAETAGGQYAVFEHRGPIWNLGATIKAIYEEWLPTSGYRCSDRGDIELYDERWSADGEDSVLEYWLGIESDPA